MLKNRAAYNKLLIQKEQERTKLDKQIRLHLNEIKKSQNIAKSLAEKLAKTRDELRRTKIKSRKVQNYIGEATSVKLRRKSSGVLPNVTQTVGTKAKLGIQSTIGTSLGYKSVSPLKRTLNIITKFKIKSDHLNRDIPVNVTPNFVNSTTLSGKAGKILQQVSKNTNPLPSLTSLYNERLILI